MSENSALAGQTQHEQLPSGKVVIRRFGDDGLLADEQHSHGLLDIGIRYDFKAGVKIDETYFANRRMVGRRTYEKARVAYPDMPPADNAIEDFGASLLTEVRKQQRRKKAEAAERLANSAESRYPRPESTNWLRVISGDHAHLVVFASRDWKLLARERTIPTGQAWLDLFGFGGRPGSTNSVARGVEVGFEVPGDREAMLTASRTLLAEINAFAQNPPETSRWSGSIRPRAKPRKPPPTAWLIVLPPLIEFLAGLPDPSVTIFNHHQ